MKYIDWQKRPEWFLAMIGYSVKILYKQLPYYEEVYNEYLKKYGMNDKCRKCICSYEMYKYADSIDIGQKQCYELVRGLRIILHYLLNDAGCALAQTDVELKHVLLVGFREKAEEKEKVLFYNGMKHEILYPQDENEQQDKYSGKKVRVIRSQKKQKTGKLTREQKEQNRVILSVRLEHAIGSIKRSRIVKDERWLRKNYFVGSRLATCAALHNFRLIDSPFHYEHKFT